MGALSRGSWAGVLGFLGACRGPEPCAPADLRPPGGAGGNVLVVVLDDVGIDRLASYGVHPTPGHTPAIDALADRSVRFTEAYGEPVCSPGRSAVLTGRRPLHTGVGTNPNPGLRIRGLPHREVTLAEALRDGAAEPWTTMAIGKWHLATLANPDPEDPREQGFDHFDGQLGTPQSQVGNIGGGRGYTFWERIVDGETSASHEYLTTAQADAAIGAMAELPEPWFVYLAFSAIHIPLETPPRALYTGPAPTTNADIGDAMLEALDHELGRVLDAVDDHTTVLLTSDNGTSREILRPPMDPAHVKGSVYAEGVQVPLFASGPGVAPGVSSSLVHLTDLFSTVLDLAGVDPADLGLELDGVSLVPELLDGEPSPRRCVFVEQFGPNGDVPRRMDQAVRNATHTLVRHEDGGDELYRRGQAVPRERVELLRAEGALTDADRAALRELRAWRRHDR